MSQHKTSGLYNSNRFARIFLESLQEITGKNGLSAILNFAGLSFLNEELPPDNLEREFDFSHFSRINQALEDIYGVRGGHGLALRVGKTTFADILKDYGDLAGVNEASFKILPVKEKIAFGLQAMASVFSDKSDQTTSVEEDQDKYLYRVHRCPVCWGRENKDDPVCYYLVGFLQEGLHWVSGGKHFTIKENKCLARGDDCCEFIVPKQPLE